MSERVMSCNLTPGVKLQHRDGKIVTLDRRKDPADHDSKAPFWPGWWIVEGGGLADMVYDAPNSEWEPLSPHSIIRKAGKCEVHNDLAWLYDDGSISCMDRLVVESHTSNCRWVPMPTVWLQGVVDTGPASAHSQL